MSKKSKFTFWFWLTLLTLGAALYWRGFRGWEDTALIAAAAGGAWLILLTLPGACFRAVRRRRYLRSPLAAIDGMSGREFEDFLSAYFESLGYRVEETPASNDYGVDLLCHDREECLAVQAKRYSGTVGVHAVQELLSGMAYYQTEQGLVVTNAYFSRQARELAEKGGVALWDRDDLARYCRLR